MDLEAVAKKTVSAFGSSLDLPAYWEFVLPLTSFRG